MDEDKLPIKVDATFKGNLADITKLGAKIIDTLANACGVVYEPVNKVLNAKADATAKLIEVRGNIEAEAMRKVLERFISQQLRQQRNVDEIVSKAILDKDAGPVSDQSCDPDWVNEFVDCSKNVSDEQMQALLARILAGEVAQPGKFSRRTMNFVKTLSRSELETFARVCGFVWTANQATYFIPRDEYQLGSGHFEEPTFGDIQLCRTIGLLHSEASYKFRSGTSIHFAGNKYVIADGKSLEIAAYPLSQTGMELVPAIKHQPLRSAVWCWLPRWAHALATTPELPPPKTVVKAKELPTLDDASLKNLLNSTVEHLNFWGPGSEESHAADVDEVMTLYRLQRIKDATKAYMTVREEVLRRNPEMESELAPLNFPHEEQS